MTRETPPGNPNSRRRHGLGRGLGALLGRATARGDDNVSELAAQAETGGIRELPIAAIQANPRQPRARFEQDSLAELAASIREHGVIQPLIVTESPDQPQRYWLITGERRWRAARQAGISTVPAVVRAATPQQFIGTGVG